MNDEWEDLGTEGDDGLCCEMRIRPKSRLKATMQIYHKMEGSDEFLETISSVDSLDLDGTEGASVAVTFTNNYEVNTIDSILLGETLDLLFSTPEIFNFAKLKSTRPLLYISISRPHVPSTSRPLNRSSSFPYRASHSPVHQIIYVHCSSPTDSAETFESAIADYASLLGRASSQQNPDEPLSSRFSLHLEDTRSLQNALDGVSTGR